MNALKVLAVTLSLGLLLTAGNPVRANGDAPQKPWRIGAWIGRAYVDLGDVEADRLQEGKALANEFMTDWWGSGVGNGGSTTVKVDDVKAGATIGAEVGYLVNPTLGLGVKVGVLQPPDLTSEVTGTGDFNETLKYSETIETSLIPLLFGGWVEGGKPVGFHYRGSLFLGPSFGSGEAKLSHSFTDPTGFFPNESLSATVPLSGNAFAFEVGAGVGYGLSDTLSLFVDVLYLAANVKEMKATKDVDVNGDGVIDVKKGDADTDANNKAIAYNFSGLNLKLGVRIAF